MVTSPAFAYLKSQTSAAASSLDGDDWLRRRLEKFSVVCCNVVTECRSIFALFKHV